MSDGALLWLIAHNPPCRDIRVDEDRIAALPEEDFDTSLPSAIVAHDTDDWRLDNIVTSGEVMRGRGMMVMEKGRAHPPTLSWPV